MREPKMDPARPSLVFEPFWKESPDDHTFLNELADCFHLENYPPHVFKRQIWGDPGFDPSLCLLIRMPQGWGFAMGVVRTSDSQCAGYIKMIAVTPECRGQGLGKRLMLALEKRLFDAGASNIRIGEAAPCYLVPGLDPRYTEAWLMFEALGYRRLGQCFNLKVDLVSLFDGFGWKPERGPDPSLVFRRARVSDRTVVCQFLEAHWPGWQQEIGLAFANQPLSLHLAFEGGRLLGFSAYDGNHRGIGWFGPMGTAPGARGRGIGERLLLSCLRDLRDQGLTSAVIPWVGPVGFYRKTAGAQIDRVFFRCQKDRQPESGAASP